MKRLAQEKIFLHTGSLVGAEIKNRSLGKRSIEVLPGQYFDKETNTHYNYYRDFDPAQGRYIESDPIGLRGDINTYVYVISNPLSNSDALGLKTVPDKKKPPTPKDLIDDEGKRGKPPTCADRANSEFECRLCCADARRPLIERLAEPGTICAENCARKFGITKGPGSTSVCSTQ